MSGVDYRLLSISEQGVELTEADINNPIYIIPDNLVYYTSVNRDGVTMHFRLSNDALYVSGVLMYAEYTNRVYNRDDTVAIYFEATTPSTDINAKTKLNVFGYGLNPSTEQVIATIKGHASSYWLRQNPDSTRANIQITQGSPESETGFGFNVQPLPPDQTHPCLLYTSPSPRDS